MGHVTVVGSVNMDIVVSAPALPAPGETVGGRSLSFLPGGKGANQAVAAARAGAHTSLVGCVGDDEWADTLAVFLASAEVNVDHLRRVAGPTGIALVTVADDGSNAIVVVPGANATLRAGDCFAGVLAAGLADGASLAEAADVACAACAVQVERPGAGPAMPDRDEIVSAVSRPR